MFIENLKNIKISTVALLCCITFTACNDAIFVDPADEIVESNAILNLADVQSAVIGAYGSIPATTNIAWNAWFTDELKLGADNNGQGIQVHTWSINSDDGNANTLFSSYFVPINRANRVLDAIETISVSEDETATINGLKGEMLALRAFTHFKLLTYFSGSYTDGSALAVPYLDFSVVLEKPARNTVSEVFAGIADDLNQASTLIPASSNTNVFFTRNAIIALEARIALYKEDYQTAITKSSQLISQYPLATMANYSAMWQDANDTEIIFKLARTEGDGAVGQTFSPNPTLIYFVASDKLTAMYEPADIRLSTTIQAADQRILKYPGTASTVGLNHIKEFRISEQYLIRAEAYANTSQVALAANDINTLRTNRITGYTPVNFSGSADAISNILDERFKELSFEGHRFLDLKRSSLAVDRGSSDCDQLAADACDLPSSSHLFTLPIPQSELFTNPNMEPNPGYNN